MKKIFTIALIALVAAAVQADVVSLNFSINNNDIYTIEGDDETWGVEDVGNWNNVLTDRTGSNLIDDSGNATTIDFDLDAAPDNLVASGNAGDRHTAFRSYYLVKANDVVLSLADIGGTFKLSEGYDVYVYLGDLANAGTASDGTTTIGYVGSGVTPVPDDATSDALGNYVKFSGLTTDTLALTISRVGGAGTDTSISGIQIVGTAIPEPAVVGLLGMGGFVTLLVRRFKRA